MRVAVLQVAYGDDEPMDDRVERVAALVREQQGHDLVVLPELWAPGGFSYREWAGRAQPVDGPIGTAMAAAARDAGVMLHAGSIVERPGDGETGPEGRGLWNTSLVYAADGSLVATYRKIHRFGFGAGEPRLMDAGEDVVLVDLPGGAGRAGLSTCYDLRFPELYRRQLDAGATAFVVPAAWPAARVRHWTLLAHARAIEDQCVVIACNTAGTHAGTEMGGHSQVISATGEALAMAGTSEEVLSVEVDMDAVTTWREQFPVLQDRRL
ncbi:MULTISPECIES: carbon-nitrogen family hydrolase [unclassified Phycicoccus]|uniref:carbon-nitrogen family hydrolase n=1 Tax=unclassified Phycicoccus TaxID=2637926 RepID=UPI000702638A|nr:MULTISPECIES: carbon-nitrogen family hydrolase [unclassified Phycicoccus]KQU65168.1 apolipoprotein acyltransferase [Phycicoccus sp. Root101]KQZ89704.1 apolipoprotein acyltransferase [Phycicoccus sp. Root563]